MKSRGNSFLFLIILEFIMNWLSITLTDLFDDKSKDLTFTYSKVKSCRNGTEIYKQLNPDDLNNYINLPYLFRFIVNKNLKTKKIPYKPLFFKMQPVYDGAALKKRCPVRSFRQMSFKDFYGGLIDLFEFPGIIEKIEPLFALLCRSALGPVIIPLRT